jgi:hypothetical protein
MHGITIYLWVFVTDAVFFCDQLILTKRGGRIQTSASCDFEAHFPWLIDTSMIEG